MPLRRVVVHRLLDNSQSGTPPPLRARPAPRPRTGDNPGADEHNRRDSPGPGADTAVSGRHTAGRARGSRTPSVEDRAPRGEAVDGLLDGLAHPVGQVAKTIIGSSAAFGSKAPVSTGGPNSMIHLLGNSNHAQGPSQGRWASNRADPPGWPSPEIGDHRADLLGTDDRARDDGHPGADGRGNETAAPKR